VIGLPTHKAHHKPTTPGPGTFIGRNHNIDNRNSEEEKTQIMEENNMKTMLTILKVFLFFYISPVVAQIEVATPADITLERDGLLLRGKFYMSEGTGIFPTVILLQGFPGNETDVLGIGKILSQSGINALTFNYSGTFKSEGKTSLGNSEKDIMAAFRFLHNAENITKFKIDTAFIILGGWSYGGGVAMTYSIKHPEIKTVFTIAGVDWGEYYEEYIRNPEFKKTTDANMAKLATLTEKIRFDTGAMPDEVTEDGIIRLDSAYFLRKSTRKLAEKEILIICGWDDPLATVDQYILPLYRALKKDNAQNVSISAFQDNHFFRNSRQDVAQTIIKWIKTAAESKKSK
jgi:alpha/beta superfamily hydrolase